VSSIASCDATHGREPHALDEVNEPSKLKNIAARDVESDPRHGLEQRAVSNGDWKDGWEQFEP
jgi:hypothetical protein